MKSVHLGITDTARIGKQVSTSADWLEGIASDFDSPPPAVYENNYIRLYVKARAMLLDAGRTEDVAALDALYSELFEVAS